MKKHGTLMLTLLMSMPQMASAAQMPSPGSVLELLMAKPSSQSSQLTFREAKVELYKMTRNHPYTIYCGCELKYSGSKNKPPKPDFQKCGFTPRKEDSRAYRVEAEHVVPAYTLGHQRLCWQNGGRENCSKTDRVYAYMEGDLHNLFPAIGQVNQDRSNYRFTDMGGKPYQYGQCQMLVDFKLRQVQPPRNEVRGTIARAYLYMRDRYSLRMNEREQAMMEAWANQYPPQPWECERSKLIKSIQGNGNIYIDSRCTK
ncbi:MULTISPECIES: endonuclease [Aeromonas]|nr:MULTISPECIES: endonuclease [Aeromonas]